MKKKTLKMLARTDELTSRQNHKSFVISSTVTFGLTEERKWRTSLKSTNSVQSSPSVDSTTGIKAVLVEGLEEAIAEDKKKEELKSKRKRNSDSSDGTDDSNKVIATEKFRGMIVKELREEATKRGLDTTGTKKELLERLCNDSKSGGAEDDNNGFKEEKKEEKIVTATKKGAAVLDQWIPGHIKS